MSEELLTLDAVGLAEGIRARQVSPVEALGACLDQIEALNPRLNAIVTMVDGAMERARQAEDAVMRGESWGPLHGVPFTVKDCIDTAGIRTTGGSLIFERNVPDENATVVTRLLEAGGVMMAKTNLPEFALWWETDNRLFGRTNNPWDESRTPGGSSGGEAAAVSSRMSPLGIGSDVGGSIREPASYCGIVGLKATHGRIPLTGHWPDVLLRYMHVGPLTRTARDAALALSILSGADGADPYALPAPPPDVDLERPLGKLRIAYCPEGPFAPVSADVRQTVSRAASAFEEMGHHVELVSLESWNELSGQAISDAIYAAEGRHWLTPIVEGKEDMLAAPIRRRLAAPAPSMQEYQEAVADCELLRQDAARLFAAYDLLLCPSTPIPAHPHGAAKIDVDGVSVVGRNALRATIPFDLTGSPAVSVPFGRSSDGLPIGVQLVGRHLDEATALRAAAALEEAGST